MFTQAGFNHRVSRICFARSRCGRLMKLYKFECGDYAWLLRGALKWPEHIQIRNLFYVDSFSPYYAEKSVLPR